MCTHTHAYTSTFTHAHLHTQPRIPQCKRPHPCTHPPIHLHIESCLAIINKTVSAKMCSCCPTVSLGINKVLIFNYHPMKSLTTKLIMFHLKVALISKTFRFRTFLNVETGYTVILWLFWCQETRWYLFYILLHVWTFTQCGQKMDPF